MPEGLSPKGIVRSQKKLQVGTGVGGLEKEFEDTQTILRKES